MPRIAPRTKQPIAAVLCAATLFPASMLFAQSPPAQPAYMAEQPTRTKHAMVATCEHNATDAGVAILKQGGNAIDAAVAVGFALAVVCPRA